MKNIFKFLSNREKKLFLNKKSFLKNKKYSWKIIPIKNRIIPSLLKTFKIKLFVNVWGII